MSLITEGAFIPQLVLGDGKGIYPEKDPEFVLHDAKNPYHQKKCRCDGANSRVVCVKRSPEITAVFVLALVLRRKPLVDVLDSKFMLVCSVFLRAAAAVAHGLLDFYFDGSYNFEHFLQHVSTKQLAELFGLCASISSRMNEYVKDFSEVIPRVHFSGPKLLHIVKCYGRNGNSWQIQQIFQQLYKMVHSTESHYYCRPLLDMLQTACLETSLRHDRWGALCAMTRYDDAVFFQPAGNPITWVIKCVGNLDTATAMCSYLVDCGFQVEQKVYEEIRKKPEYSEVLRRFRRKKILG